MDLNMPGMGGLEVARRVVSGDSACKVIGLSMYVEGPYSRRFMELGGSGYVSKAAETDELMHAIRTVAQPREDEDHEPGDERRDDPQHDQIVHPGSDGW